MTRRWSKQDSNPRSPRTTTRDDRLRSLGGEVLGDERCVRRRIRDIRRRRASFFLDLGEQPGLNRGGRRGSPAGAALTTLTRLAERSNWSHNRRGLSRACDNC
jgi:hypothetical protein